MVWFRTGVNSVAATIEFTGFKTVLSTEIKAPIPTSGKIQ